MNDAELDRILAAEEEIVPSAGFASSVMAAVQREAINAPILVPTPITFPWAIALPGLLACLLLVGVTIMQINQSVHPSGSSIAQSVPLSGVANGATNLANLAVDQAMKLPSLVMQTEQQAANMGLGWLLAALMFSYIAVELVTLNVENRR